LSASEGRRFGLTVGTAFVALGAVAAWRGREPMATACAAAGVMLILAGLLVPGRLGPLFRGWMGLAHLMSKVTTPVFMGIVYFGVFTPVGMAMRLFGRRPVDRQVAGGASRWKGRTGGVDRRAAMERQF
jgi:hypothetical protein